MKYVRAAVGVLIWASVATVIVGFWLPWASIDLREPETIKHLASVVPDFPEIFGDATKKAKHVAGRVMVTIRRGTETITGDLPTLSDVPRHVSGVQIPQLAHQKNAQIVVALFEMVTKKSQHVGAKSYLVYLLPGMALLFGLLLTWVGNRRVVAFVVGVFCAVVAGLGFWKLLTTNMKTLFVAITVGPGLWMSLWAYVGLAACAATLVVLQRRRTSL